MYIDREDTGKEKTPTEIERDASVWRPPGKVVIRRKCINIKRWGHDSTPLIDTVT